MIGVFKHNGGTIGNDEIFIEELTDTSDTEYPRLMSTGSDADKVRAWIKKMDEYKIKLLKE